MTLETANTETDDIGPTDYEIEREKQRQQREVEDRRAHVLKSGRKTFFSIMPSLGVKDVDGLFAAIGGASWLQNYCTMHPEEHYLCAVHGGQWVPLREALAKHPVVLDWLKNQAGGGNAPMEAKQLELDKLKQEDAELARQGVSQNWVVIARTKIRKRIKELEQQIYNERVSKASPDQLPGFVPAELRNELAQVEQQMEILKREIYSQGVPPDARDHRVHEFSGLSARKQQLQKKIAAAANSKY